MVATLIRPGPGVRAQVAHAHLARAGVGGGSGFALSLPATAGNYVSTPDKASLDLAGDMCIVWRGSLPDWDAAGNRALVSKYGAVGNRSFLLGMFNASLRLIVTADGTTAVDMLTGSVLNAADFVDGRPMTLAVTFDLDNGSALRATTFWKRVNDTDPWTQITTITNATAVASIFNSSQTVDIGGRTGGTADLHPHVVEYVQMFNGIGANTAPGQGTIVASPDFRAGITPYTDLQGNVWTISGAAWSWVNRPGARFGVSLPGVTGNYIMTPDTPALDITGDLEFVLRVTQNDWETLSAVAQGFIAKFDGPSGTGRSFFLRRSNAVARGLDFQWSSTGAAAAGTASWTYPAGVFPAGGAVWLRLRFDVDNGNNQWVATLDYSTAQTQDEPTDWTLITGPVPTAPATSIFAGTFPLVLGSDSTGSRAVTGRILRAIVRNGLGGTPVANFDLRTPLNNTPDGLGNTWQIVGTGSSFVAA